MMRSALLMIALCAGTARAQQTTPFEHGVVLFRAGDYAAAVAPLEQAHAADPRDSDTALLLGITYYHLGRVDDAVPLLAHAETNGDDDTKASARVFLGLIADARGESGRAQDYYALVARSPTELGTTGRLLLEQNGPERWSLVAIVAPGYDSNVSLVPTTAAPPGPGRGGRGTGDAELSAIVAGSARPVPDIALVLDETLTYRHYAQQTTYDLFANFVGASYTFAATHDRAQLAYHFDASTLGGSRYELTHVADATYRHALSDSYALGARYTFSARDYAQAEYAGYTGLDHTAGVELAWGSSRAPTEGWAGYVFERESTDDPTLASTSHGARGQVSLHLAKDTLLRGSALALARTFDSAAMGRSDVLVRADATLYIGLSGLLGIVTGVTFVRNVSNAADYDYAKWTAFAGLAAGR